MRSVHGVLVVEGIQTGDGRVMAENAITWVDPPLPLAWLRDGDQHVSLIEVAPTIGTIDTITRNGASIEWTGSIDDEQPDGAEVVRRMDAGLAPLGNRFGLSIDPDDWEFELIAMDGEDDMLMILASIQGESSVPVSISATNPRLRRLAAAAGDPDPGASGDGTVLFADSADSLIQRFTRLRIRGATFCAIGAFAETFGELDGAAPAAATASATGVGLERPPAAVGIEVSGTGRPFVESLRSLDLTAAFIEAPVEPPAEWFARPPFGDDGWELVDQPDPPFGSGGQACPLRITDDGRVGGHLAAWGQCHTGYAQECVSPPSSPSDYAHFRLGEVRCADGSCVATGPLVMGCDHAALNLDAQGARDHYAHSGLAWADVVTGEDEHGPWFAGALRPTVTASQVRSLRAGVLSGDWRMLGGRLDLIAVLAVNTPGFPLRRLAASADPASTAQLRLDGHGRPVALVASGQVSAHGDGCGCGSAATRQLLRRIEVLERRTAHVVPDAVAAAADRIRTRRSS